MLLEMKHEKNYLLGFSFYINIGNFEVFFQNSNLSAKHFFWRFCVCYTATKVGLCRYDLLGDLLHQYN